MPNGTPPLVGIIEQITRAAHERTIRRVPEIGTSEGGTDCLRGRYLELALTYVFWEPPITTTPIVAFER